MFRELLFTLSNYQWNPHAVGVMVVSVLIFSIGLFIFFQVKKSIKNVAFFLLCTSLSLWLFGTGMVYLSALPETALLWYKCLTFLGVVSIMPSAYLFSVASAGSLARQRGFVFVSFVISYVFYFAALFTDKFITGPKLYFWGYYPHYEVANLFFLIFYLAVFITVQANLWNAYRRESIPIKRNQVLIIIVGFFIGFIASSDYIAKVWNFGIYPFGFLPIFIFTCLLAYSIIRYKAFDIETVIHKTALWILSFSLIVVPVFFLYRFVFPYIETSSFLRVSFWVTAFLVFALYLRVIQPRIDHLFQRRRYNLEETAARFTEDLVHLRGFDKLIQRIQDTIADTLYSQQIDIFIYKEDEAAYVLVNKRTALQPVEKIDGANPFLRWLREKNMIAYREFVDIDPVYASVRQEGKTYFEQTEAIVSVPLVLGEKLLGVINLGRKANLRRYSANDFHFLTTLKNQSAIALSNSLLYENMEEQVKQRTKELVDVQRQLVQAEKLATVGTLAGGVAHEINNPLTAILTNAQMLLASGTMDDPELLKESLELIEEATKRCRTIVKKLMTYAKKPLESADFSRVNILDVLKGVTAFVGYQLEQENIKISIDADDDAYYVDGNQNELEQIVTNIVLNGKDAIKYVKKKGSIHISLLKKNGWIEITIKDEGEGIPPEVVPKLFDPFFTTKDVGKGLGLGLSICQAIAERHNGMITVSSKRGEGSLFTIKLPQARIQDRIV